MSVLELAGSCWAEEPLPFESTAAEPISITQRLQNACAGVVTVVDSSGPHTLHVPYGFTGTLT